VPGEQYEKEGSRGKRRLQRLLQADLRPLIKPQGIYKALRLY
jgi:hypothetical protein